MTYSRVKSRQLLWDISGAFGDIGVLFPISIALVAQNGFNPTALFLSAGLFYILSARYFRITMPVQPLKAMSAVAIAGGLGSEVINAAGIILGLLLVVLALTGLSNALGRIFPVPVIRGIQLGLGMMLVRASVDFIGSDIFMALLVGIILLANMFLLKELPPLLFIILIGSAIALGQADLSSFGPVSFAPGLPDPGLFWMSFTMLVLPQISLTIGNAVVATEATAKMLYKERAEKVTFKSVPLSIGVANIASGLVGGVPMCHGSGGLTAHRKFGAATERSGYIIGSTLLVLALFFGTASLSVVAAFPGGILGALLCYVGLQHALLVRDIQHDPRAMFIALSVALPGFLTHNLTVGFLTGVVLYYGLNVLERMNRAVAIEERAN